MNLFRTFWLAFFADEERAELVTKKKSLNKNITPKEPVSDDSTDDDFEEAEYEEFDD